jgi:hypothetical protein
MTALKEAIKQLIATSDPADPRLEFLQRILNAPKPEREHPEMPPFTRKRESLMQLRPRHLEKVDRIARRAYYDRADMHEFLLQNYDRLFGILRRPRSKEVPMDAFRKSWMVDRLLDLVEARRDEYARERSSRSS